MERFEVDGEEYAVVTWCTGEAVPAASLTAAERAVLDHVVRGASNAAIARARGTSVRTIANQVASLLRKLGAESRFALIRRYWQSGASRTA